MIHPSGNPEYLINNIEKDIVGGDNIGVPGKDNTLLGMHADLYFYQCKSRVRGYTRFTPLCDVTCWCLLWPCLGQTCQSSCGMAFPGTMPFWGGCWASQMCCRIAWALAFLRKSAGTSSVQEAVAWCGFLMHPFLRITVKSGGDCILLSWADCRYRRGTNGWQDLCCWIELQACQLQLSKHLFDRECLGEGRAPMCTAWEPWCALTPPAAGLEQDRAMLSICSLAKLGFRGVALSIEKWGRT